MLEQEREKNVKLAQAYDQIQISVEWIRTCFKNKATQPAVGNPVSALLEPVGGKLSPINQFVLSRFLLPKFLDKKLRLLRLAL